MRKPGEQIDRYVIEAPLGRGGMGEVYEATDTALGRRVALKVIAPGADPDANQRMLREARAAAAFEHPHAVVVYDVGEAGGETFLAMELVRGAALRSFVGDADVPVGRRLRWLVDVARALGAAHRHGIVHRDVKPDNVMIREDGSAKVLDFGIARRQARAVDPSAPTEANAASLQTLTAAGTVVGTPHYAAPEQLRGEALDGRADEFAWGVMAYELLAGSTPWGAVDSVALLSHILTVPAPPLADKRVDLPPEVAAAVARALEKRREERFATIDEAADAIEPFADATTTALGKAPAPAVTPKRTTVGKVVRRTGRVIYAIFAIIGGLLVLLVGAALISSGGKGARFEYAGKSAVVPALACEAAEVAGDSSKEIAEAIGRAACARLGTELGVDWGGEGKPLHVTAKLATGAAEVRLTVEKKSAEGKGPTPIDAIVAAVAELAKQVSPPAPSAEAVRAWGASDAAGARRIERVWRQLLLNTTRNDDEAVKALLASDAGSAWSHLLALLVRPQGTEASRAAVERGLALSDALPTARAHALKATFMLYEDKPDMAAHRRESLRLLRLSYTEAPDDGDVGALYAAVALGAGAREEALGVLDRLVTRSPAKCMLPLRNSIGHGVTRDLDRDAKSVAALRGILPESLAWEEPVRYLGESRRFDEARAALAFGRKLGLAGKSADAAPYDLSEAWIELAALSPKAARQVTVKLLGDPRLSVSNPGALINVASYQLEGRINEAEDAELREIERQRAVGTPALAAAMGFHLARGRRLLGRPAPEAEVLDELARYAAAHEATDPMSLRFAVEVTLWRAQGDKAKLEADLARFEARAERERERALREGLRLLLLPLTRAARGDAAAAKLWAETQGAHFDTRQAMALDAALALEADGKRAEAEAAYTLAMDPHHTERLALAAMIARVRLGALLRASGKPGEAAALDAVVDRLWGKADAGLREAAARKVK
jgi:serine/threonine-protein kinase